MLARHTQAFSLQAPSEEVVKPLRGWAWGRLGLGHLPAQGFPESAWGAWCWEGHPQLQPTLGRFQKELAELAVSLPEGSSLASCIKPCNPSAQQVANVYQLAPPGGLQGFCFTTADFLNSHRYCSLGSAL